MTFAAVLYSKT